MPKGPLESDLAGRALIIAGKAPWPTLHYMRALGWAVTEQFPAVIMPLRHLDLELSMAEPTQGTSVGRQGTCPLVAAGPILAP